MNKICRICLEEGVLSSIFTKNYNISLCDMIEYCCNIKISKNDGLPEQLCSNCVYKLGIAYHFKQTCESADVRLRQYLGLSIPSRNNDVGVMTDPIAVPTTIIKRCKCRLAERPSRSNYKRKPESEHKKRGPKPKPTKVHYCDQCDKQFRRQAHLEMHVRTHTGDKPFECMYCPQRFTQKHNLTIHLRIHTGEKPFQCEVCSKRFSAQSNLYSHLKIHTGQRDHACTLCNKSFITASELTRHMHKHRGIRNFKCDLCGASYVHAKDLKVHKMKKHQIAPPQSKIQSEAYNSGNIDIIGIDVGKDAPVKDTSHHIPHLLSDKTYTSIPAIPDQAQPLLPFEQKVVKDMFPQYPNKVNEIHSCTVCGEGFNYLTALAQHYVHRHKSYDPMHAKYALS